MKSGRKKGKRKKGKTRAIFSKILPGLAGNMESGKRKEKQQRGGRRMQPRAKRPEIFKMPGDALKQQAVRWGL